MKTETNGERWTTKYPELRTDPVPIEPCISPAFFERERDLIFRHVWLNIGREEEIPHPGDYFVKELAVTNSSILVVRGKDGRIRAFHNMCAHRGNKVAVDAFQESYHVPVLHKRSVGSAYATKENPFIHALDVTLYKLHRVMSIPGSLDYEPTPVQAIAHGFGASVLKRDGFVDRLPPGLNPTRSANWGFDQIILFPNFSVFVFDGTYITYNFWPLAVDRTLWEARTYYPQAENAGQRFSQEYAKCALRDTLLEDGSILEAVQSNLASGAKAHFILQDQEILIRHFHHVLDDFASIH